MLLIKTTKYERAVYNVAYLIGDEKEEALNNGDAVEVEEEKAQRLIKSELAKEYSDGE